MISAIIIIRAPHHLRVITPAVQEAEVEEGQFQASPTTTYTTAFFAILAVVVVPGSLSQLVVGAAISIGFLMVQMQARPFKRGDSAEQVKCLGLVEVAGVGLSPPSRKKKQHRTCFQSF